MLTLQIAIEAAKADPSDPFVARRVMSHAAVGITGYSQEPFFEERSYLNPVTGKRRTYSALAFRNVKRP